MEQPVGAALAGAEGVAFAVKAEPTEDALEATTPDRHELCGKPAPAGDQGSASVEREPRVVPEYSIDTVEVDVKQEGAARVETTEINQRRRDLSGTPFSYSGQPKRHKKLLTRGKPHPCQECGKSLTNLTLRRHMALHAGEKPHTCQECGKAFSQACNLRRHMVIHTGEKPYTCQKCGKVYSHLSSLRSHMVTHTGETPHTCQKCGRVYSHSSSLRNHMVVHTGEKPYACHECGKAFFDRSSLLTHKKTHTGERPHTCHLCGNSFALLNTLRSW